MLLLLLSALSLGFIGSFHCIGMCGPIALTLPVQHLQGAYKLAGIWLYNGGRISAYALMGMLFGWMGRQFYLGGLQQWLSIALGSALLLIVLLPYLTGRKQQLFTLPGIFTNGIKNILGQLLRRRQFHTLYAIGFFNGLLPCGLVYLGITGAIATGHLFKGALFMMAFGAGTLPAMITLSMCSQLISIRARHFMKRSIPFVMAAMGLLLIIRGMNLGIPYLSPAIAAGNTAAAIHCHQP